MSKEIVLELITAVKEHPILYDTTLNSYKNTYEKRLVWQNIAKTIGGKNGESVSWKWKNLRDGYSKYLRALHTPTDSDIQKMVNWRWAEHMKFMDPFMRIIKDMHANDSMKRTISPVAAKRQRESSFEIIQDDSSSDEEVTENSNKLFDGDGESQEYIIENNDIMCSVKQDQLSNDSEKLDKIDYLFLNYADTFKKLNRRKQVILKLQMAKMFAEAELQEMDDPIKIEELL